MAHLFFLLYKKNLWFFCVKKELYQTELLIPSDVYICETVGFPQGSQADIYRIPSLFVSLCWRTLVRCAAHSHTGTIIMPLQSFAIILLTIDIPHHILSLPLSLSVPCVHREPKREWETNILRIFSDKFLFFEKISVCRQS